MKLLALLRNKICPFGKQAGGISRCFSCRGFRQTEQSERRYDQRRQGVSSPAWAADGPRTRCTLWKHNSEVTDIEKHTHTHLNVNIRLNPATCALISAWHVHTLPQFTVACGSLTEKRLINMSEWVHDLMQLIKLWIPSGRLNVPH